MARTNSENLPTLIFARQFLKEAEKVVARIELEPLAVLWKLEQSVFTYTVKQVNLKWTIKTYHFKPLRMHRSNMVGLK